MTSNYLTLTINKLRQIIVKLRACVSYITFITLTVLKVVAIFSDGKVS